MRFFLKVVKGVVLFFYCLLALSIIGRSILLNYPKSEWSSELIQYSSQISDVTISVIWTLMCVLSMISITQIGSIVQHDHEPLPLDRSVQKIVLLIGTFAYAVTVNGFVYQSFTITLNSNCQILQLFPASFMIVHGFVQIVFVRPRDYEMEAFTRVSNVLFNLVMLIHLVVCVLDSLQSKPLSMAFLITTPFEVIHRVIALIIFWQNPISFLLTYARFLYDILKKIMQWIKRPFNMQENGEKKDEVAQDHLEIESCLPCNDDARQSKMVFQNMKIPQYPCDSEIVSGVQQDVQLNDPDFSFFSNATKCVQSGQEGSRFHFSKFRCQLEPGIVN